MKSKEIIKKAQRECGEYATGYREDISFDSLNLICEAMWTRSKNLTFTFSEWLGEVMDVIGKKAFTFWHEDIMAFKYKKMNDGKYSMFHGERYCA